MDEKFQKLEAAPFDVKDTLDQCKDSNQIANFWERAIMNHPNLSEHVYEKDRPILRHLKNIKLTLHEDYGFGFDLEF